MTDVETRSQEREPSRLRGEWLEMLLDVSRRINAEVDPDAVLRAIVANLVSITGADRGVLLLRDAEGRLSFAFGQDREGRGLAPAGSVLCRDLVDEVARRGETRLIDDASAVDGWSNRPAVQDLRLRTILCVPLKTTAGVLGVIYVDSLATSRRLTEEDVTLVEAFAAGAATALERVRLQQAELERDRMRRQLQLAAEIQRTFVPAAFPRIDGVQGALASVPALEVGGDFLDVIRLPGGRVGLLIGDVAGKGLPGALFGARLLSDFRYEALLHDGVAATLTALNRVVAGQATRGMFVTFLYALLDPRTRRLHYGNAGHPPPLLRRRDGGLEVWDAPSGLPLGVHPDTAYEAGTRLLEPGQTLLLLTDGLADAASDGGERFGIERVRQVVAESAGEPHLLVDALLRATARFTGRHRQTDDETLLAVALDPASVRG